MIKDRNIIERGKKEATELNKKEIQDQNTSWKQTIRLAHRENPDKMYLPKCKSGKKKSDKGFTCP